MMATTTEVKSFLDKVDSIQTRFMESLTAGQPDATYREAEAKSSSDDDRLKSHIDSQRGTF
jgi:hypothetical protein